MKEFALLALGAVLMGATNLPAEKDWSAELRAISAKCKLPEDRLQWVDGEVRWLKSESASYDQALCVFDEIKARDVPIAKGYVLHGSKPA